ncbi:hypothetical protein T08_5640 [Trichinella sp. T8]|nr:hypothetical protein T08_5640 [Trichinella sp. T8]
MHFTLDVAEALTKVNKAYARKSRGRVSVTANTETSRRRVRRPEPTTAARFDKVAHWPEIINQKNRCRNCQKTSRKLCFLIILSFDLNCIFNKYAYCLTWLKRRLKNLKSIRLVQSKKEIDGKAQCISFQVLSDLFSSNATTDPNG